MKNINSVLIVEDSITQREHLAHLLGQMGIEHVHEAVNGFEALRWLEDQTQCPDVLFCDLSMPIMDGVALLQAVASRGYQSGVVVLSGHDPSILSTVGRMAQATGLNFLGTLEKPPHLECLFDVLSTYRRNPAPGKKTTETAAGKYSMEEIAEGIRKKQMICHFQPKVSMTTGALKGVEALVRWQHPVQGLVYPSAFIPVIEGSAALEELTLDVLTHSMEQLHRWSQQGLTLSININLSPEALASPDFAQSIADQVALHNIRPDSLVLEVTESAVVRNLAQSLATVARLRLMGFGLSIDDYGTGYSSMQQLAQLPFTELKLDRSLVNGISHSKKLHALCESAIQMARKLGLVSVAEGIETKEDFALLRALGCDLAQGYYVAKPMTSEALLRWQQDRSLSY